MKNLNEIRLLVGLTQSSFLGIVAVMDTIYTTGTLRYDVGTEKVDVKKNPHFYMYIKHNWNESYFTKPKVTLRWMCLDGEYMCTNMYDGGREVAKKKTDLILLNKQARRVHMDMGRAGEVQGRP